jgi:ubiquinone/menaquinone biosynthesis C-methylase UbiE
MKMKLKKLASKLLFSKIEETGIGTHNEEARYQWVEKTLGKIPSGHKILDAGAGELKFKKYCTHLEYVSQDFAQYDGEGDSSGLQTQTWDNSKLDIVSDITAIPVDDDSFDAVMCNEVIEHVPDPVKALKELNRVLRPGGYLVVTAPFASLTHFAPYHFSTGFNRYFYKEHLEALGYEILDLHANGNYFEYMAQELRRVQNIGKKYAELSADSLEKSSIKVVLSYLNKLSERDKGSEELLCFGFFVFARKKG